MRSRGLGDVYTRRVPGLRGNTNGRHILVVADDGGKWGGVVGVYGQRQVWRDDSDVVGIDRCVEVCFFCNETAATGIKKGEVVGSVKCG